MKNKTLTLGSLFDGSGTFPVAGILSGITPIWASEIEPFCIRVTTKRLPQIKHYGDISAINGAEIEPVDIITFGSPCTDGRRKKSRIECRTLRTVLSGSQNYQGNEVCDKWQVSEIRSVGKRWRCFLLKRRRRLPVRP